ncbi:HAD family hydrolase [Breznakiella homolactica]|uniref:phosphoglycolate phosphatase n=1 Tax=Breznakiella homolactica TaxID=2798577 RepID=A0A7T7XME5_9SPIR|nr:HAD family hydrolase [Breznakiella homolactica]QQO08966.1 HAD family hydrolase [Breznakiella homolactica]
MKPYKAVIFDFDMTIADSEAAILHCLYLTADHFSYQPMAPEQIRPVIGNIPEIMLEHITGEKDPEKLREMKNWYRQISAEKMSGMITFFPGVREGLKRLQGAGIRTGVVSLKLYELMRVPLERDGILPFLDKIYGLDQVAAHKPDPEGLVRMAAEFNLEKGEVLYTGDSLVDQKTAENGGFDFAAMLLGATSREQFLRSGPMAAAFSSFGELTAAVLQDPA